MIYDHGQGRPPEGAVDTAASAGLALAMVACVAVVVLVVLNATVVSSSAVVSDISAMAVRWGIAAASVVPAVVGDPTYASLLMAVPLIDIRRRGTGAFRWIGAALLMGLVAVLVLTERTSNVVAEVEAAFALAITFVIITVLGDALRHVDMSADLRSELAQLTERNRLAEELHDGVGHHLLAASLQLKKASAFAGSDPARSSEAVGYAEQAVTEAIADTRFIVDSTRATHGRRFDIATSLGDLTRRVLPPDTIVSLEVTGDHSELEQRTQLALYRVAQEALSNLVRHSSASDARITSTVDASVATLVIADNGRGIPDADLKGPGGLANMTERIAMLGGVLEVESSSAGTSIIATVPR